LEQTQKLQRIPWDAAGHCSVPTPSWRTESGL